MAFTHRLFGLLDAEIRKSLSFSFSVTRNLSRPGAPAPRPQDRLEIRVWVRNDTGLALLDVRGAIRPTSSSRFDAVPFEIRRLAPGDEHELATIDVRLLDVRATELALNQLATVSVSAHPDLSDFRFRDAGRLLTHVKPTSHASGAIPISRIEPARRSRRPYPSALAR